MGDPPFSVIAILSTFNEEDIIGQVVRYLIDEGVGVYLLDDGSTDGTVAAVERYLGRGLLRIEHFGENRPEGPKRFRWGAILERKEALAQELGASWFIHHDADEFRESPWEHCSLRDAIRRVDALGYTAIDFECLNFRPTHAESPAVDDVRRALPRFEQADPWDRVQIKCWKKTRARVDLTSTGGHEAIFAGRTVFPLRFILRHYPIRSQAHGERKVLNERLPRFLAEERERGWHVQYDRMAAERRFVYDAAQLVAYDPDSVRLHLSLRHRGIEELETALADARTRTSELEHQVASLLSDREQLDAFRRDATTNWHEAIRNWHEAISRLATLVSDRDRLAGVAARLNDRIVALTAERDSLEAAEQRAATSLERLRGERDRLIEEEVHSRVQVRASLATLASERDHLAAKLTELEATIDAERALVAASLATLASERDHLAAKATELEATIDTERALLANSLAWRAVLRYQRFIDTRLPISTSRRRAYEAARNSVKKRVVPVLPPPPPATDGRDSALSAPSASLDPGGPDIQTIEPANVVTEYAQPAAATAALIPDRAACTQADSPSSRLPSASTPPTPIPVSVSVVIPTKNGVSEDVGGTLRAVFGQQGIENLEVIVVDSGSSDDTVAVAQASGARVSVIPPDEFNHGGTRNHGAEQGVGDFIVFMVQDALPATADLFHSMATALCADPTLAGITVRQVPRADADVYACWEIWNHNKTLFDVPSSPVEAASPSDQLSPLALRRSVGLDNVCSMVRRSVWESIRFKPTAYAEDLEFGLSCLKRGYRIGRLANRAVIHSHTRHPAYYLARYYIDRRTLLGLFPENGPPDWMRHVSDDQLFTSVNDLYAAIGESTHPWKGASPLNPAARLRGSVAYCLSRGAGNMRGRPGAEAGTAGEPTLDAFFSAMDGVFGRDEAPFDQSALRFEGTVNAILTFIGGRYPSLDASELRAVLYKAYANAAGTLLAEYSFWTAAEGRTSAALAVLDDELTRASRRR